MTQSYLKNVQLEGQRANPLFAFLGVAVDAISKEKVTLRLPFQHHFIQGAGAIAGGIMAALADEAMAHVVLANLSSGETTATIEMNIRYLKGAVRGDMVAEAVIVKKGRRVVAVRADILDERGRLLAQAGASFMIMEKKV